MNHLDGIDLRLSDLVRITRYKYVYALIDLIALT